MTLKRVYKIKKNLHSYTYTTYVLLFLLNKNIYKNMFDTFISRFNPTLSIMNPIIMVCL